MRIEVWGICLYVLCQLLMGFWASRSVKTEKDYFLAGRSLGVLFASFSIFSTWFGAETCVGSAGAVFEKGLVGARMDPFGYTLCLILFGLLVAGPFRKKCYVTVGDFYRDRFGEKVERLAVLILIPTSIIWAGAQVRAFGQILALLTDLNTSMGIATATGIVIIYTFLGGMLADVLTDFVQGLVLITGLVIMAVLVFHQIGDVSEVLSAISSRPLSLVDPSESFWGNIDSWAIPILGSLTSQEIISKSLSCRTSSVAKKSAFTAALLYISVGMIPVFLGMVGPLFIKGVSHSDLFMLTFAEKLLPQTLFIIFSGAMVSAILSTVDSTLLSVSALFSHNVILKIWPEVSEKKKVYVGRSVVLFGGIMAYLMAISSDRIHDLVELAASFGAGGLFIVFCLGLFTKIKAPKSALWTLVIGLIPEQVYEYLGFDAPFLTSHLFCLSCFFLFYFGEVWHKKTTRDKSSGD